MIASSLRIAFSTLLGGLIVLSAWAQKNIKGNHVRSSPYFVERKNYYLLTLFEENKEVNDLLASDTALIRLAKTRLNHVHEALHSNNYHVIVNAVCYTEDEIRAIEQELSRLYDRSPALRNLVIRQLILSGCYGLYGDNDPRSVLLRACEADARGINWVIAVYADGQKPHYPDIDSISFEVNSEGYTDTLKAIVRQAMKQADKSKLFFELPMQCALGLLQASGRLDAGNYEPMEKTVNKAAANKSKHINWNNYPYTVLLVPGEGPEQYGVKIDPISKLRCRLAFHAYQQKLAPFILVSGGKVHPYKTHFCEAAEMKRFLMDSLNVPESNIIMDPHARHTTTNMRNGVRLMIKYGLPMAKPALVICEKEDEDYISQMSKRCEKELGYVPYRLGKRINDTELEFYPEKTTLTVNSTEPLDP